MVISFLLKALGSVQGVAVEVVIVDMYGLACAFVILFLIVTPFLLFLFMFMLVPPVKYGAAGSSSLELDAAPSRRSSPSQFHFRADGL